MVLIGLFHCEIDGYKREIREVGRDSTGIITEDFLAEGWIGGRRADGDQIFMEDSMRRENGEGESCQKKSRDENGKILRATHCWFVKEGSKMAIFGTNKLLNYVLWKQPNGAHARKDLQKEQKGSEG